MIPEEPLKEHLVLDFAPTFTALKKQVPVSIDFSNITYSIGAKQILKNVSGSIEAQSVVALLGPSGAGKTTLLNLLAGRVQSRANRVLSGKLKVNGTEMRPERFRASMAYVTQDDALWHTSTVREALDFSARLRLPTTYSDHDRELLVQDLIESLGLAHVQNTYIGSALVRGLSGGEKKRVAIGVELVSSPSCIFLDEPTSGLDSYSAWKVVRILNAVSAKGCTVLCSIHQPPAQVFAEFSHAFFLGQGQIVYQGQVSNLDKHFASHGLAAPKHVNLAEHVMMLIQSKPIEEVCFPDSNPKNPSIDVESNPAKVSTAQPLAPLEAVERAGFFVQVSQLFLRELRGKARDTQQLVAKFGVVIFLFTLFAVVFLYAGDISRPSYTVQTHFGAITFSWVMAMFAAAQPALLVFPFERVVFLREKATETYSSAAYMVAKLLVELPLDFFCAVLMMLIAFWAMDLTGSWIYLVLSLWELMIASTSTALILGAAIADPKAAVEAMPVVFIPQMLFVGFFVEISQLPIWLQWVQWITPLKYSIDLAVLNEFNPALCVNPYNPATCTQWASVLATNNVTYDRVGLYVGVLLAIAVVYRIVALVILNAKARNFES